MFPGACAAWTTEENAKKSLEAAGDRSGQTCQRVIYKVEAPVLEVAGCRAFAHRFSAKISDCVDDSDNKTQVITLTALEGEEALKAKMGTTIADWKAAVEEKKKAAEAAPADAAMMDGEGMMDGEMAMEGEMAAAE